MTPENKIIRAKVFDSVAKAHKKGKEVRPGVYHNSHRCCLLGAVAATDCDDHDAYFLASEVLNLTDVSEKRKHQVLASLELGFEHEATLLDDPDGSIPSPEAEKERILEEVSTGLPFSAIGFGWLFFDGKWNATDEELVEVGREIYREFGEYSPKNRHRLELED